MRKSTIYPVLFAGFFLLTSLQSFSQLGINVGVSGEDMVENIVGEGVTYDNVVFTGAQISRGIFTNGSSTNIGLESGIILTSGSATIAIGPNNSGSDGLDVNMPGDPQLNVLAGQTTHDASVLEFDFWPEADTLTFRYVFGSDEYEEWVGSSFNDVFGYFVTGPNPAGGNYVNKNIAVVPGTNVPITINTINDVFPSYPQYYVDNGGGLTIEYDGFTTVLTAWILVEPCQTYHMKMAVADASDGIYDTGVFLEENSFNSIGIEVQSDPYPAGISDNMVEGCVTGQIIFELPDVSFAPYTVHYEIEGVAQNGIDYSWIPDTLYIPAGQDTASHTIFPYYDGIPEGVEDIIFIVENTLGCDVQYDSTTFEILDYTNIEITGLTGDPQICEGECDTLSVSATGGIFPYIYQWTGTIDNNDTVVVCPDTTTNFVINVSDLCGGEDSDSLLVQVFPNPEIDLGADTILCSSDTLLLDPQGSYQFYTWQDGTHDTAYYVTEPGTYWVKVTGSGGCIGSDSIDVAFYPGTSVDLGNDTIVCGDSYILEPGDYELYLWQDGSTDSVYVVDTTGFYWVQITDMNGCHATDSIFVEIHSPFDMNLGQDTAMCYGDTIHLNAGSGYIFYEWQDGSNDSIYVVDTAGVYYVEVIDDVGCVARDTIEIDLYPISNVELGADTAICEDDELILNAGEGFITYVWQDGAGGQYYTVDTTGVYWVEITDANGCHAYDTITVEFLPLPDIDLGQDQEICEGDSVVFNAGGGYMNYEWHDGTTDSTYTATESGIYYVTVFNNCGADTDTVELTVYPKPQPELGEDTTICAYDQLQLNPGTFNEYLWQDGSTDPFLFTEGPGAYWVKVTSIYGCANRDTIVVDISDPEVDLGTDTTLCEGDTLVLDAGAGFENYVWQDNSSGQYFNAIDSGYYFVQVIDDIGCMASDDLEIGIAPLPQVELGIDTAMCPGDQITLNAGGGYQAYYWQGSPADSIYTVSSPGTFTVEVVNSCGSATDDIYIDFYAVPDPQLGPDTTISIGQEMVLFPGEFDEYLWSDGSTDSVYMISTPDTVYVTVSNGFCFASDTIFIDGVPCDVNMPNVFTPNWDGKNDEFGPMEHADIVDVSNYTMLIFDRWGRKIYEADELYKLWDGKNNSGGECAPGTYFWIVEYTCTESGSATFTKKGSVMLLR